MAEIAANIVFDKLVSLLRDEVNLLRDVRRQLTSIKDELQLIRACLKDADAKAEMAERTDDGPKEWVKQMRQVSYRIDDVIDEYLYQVAYKRPHKRGATVVLCQICDCLRTIRPGHVVSSQIGDIRESLEKLNKAKEAYGFNISTSEGAESSNLHYLRRDAYFIEDDQLVGVDHTKQVLTNLLKEKGKRTVISVVGEGGLGKTTIARNVYNKQKERGCFDRYAWVTVGRSLREEHLWKTLLKSFYDEASDKKAAKENSAMAVDTLYDEAGDKKAVKEISEMDVNTLIGKVKEYLKGRSYMVVFDDVWEIELWGGVKSALPEDKGKIIITTRNKEVAEFCKESTKDHIHELEPLRPGDALKLFYLKAFPFDPAGCSKGLMELSQEFVKKCDGVPLAIVAIAGLLSRKRKTVVEWKKVYDSLRSKFSSDPHLRSFHQVLLESYHDLGYHLKLCLLYFGLFPEDYSISCVRLINLWVAEGFVEDRENEPRTLEEVAEGYLTELIARNLVKVTEVYFDGRVRSCRVHDLMHNFILIKCEELNFCQVKKGERFRFHEWTRRLSIDTNIKDATMEESAANYGLVRSCFVFNIQDMPDFLVESLFSSFKLLIRLDCEDAPLNYLPEKVGNLFHLKYLNLRNTKIKTIPKFIGKLKNLETLNLRETQVSELPVEINKLVKLRHLLAYSLWSWDGLKLKEGIGHLMSLQKLSMVDASDDGGGVIRELNNLTQMRRLGIVNLIRKNGRLLCSAIGSMTNLCSLSINGQDGMNGLIDLESLTNPPPQLQRLYLRGCLEKLPEWIPTLENLVRLELSGSRLTEDPLPLLKDLPELLELHLYKTFEGVELHFGEGWFKKLKDLRIRDMQAMKTLKIDRGALPVLEELTIGPCPQMVEVPHDIQNLQALQCLCYYDMPTNPAEGKGFGILKNIPSVFTPRATSSTFTAVQ